MLLQYTKEENSSLVEQQQYLRSFIEQAFLSAYPAQSSPPQPSPPQPSTEPTDDLQLDIADDPSSFALL
ncbi:MAG: hypothetical protein ACHQJ6_05830 [Candidatus Berkiellales bacterium]